MEKTYPFLETIRLEDGVAQLMGYHLRRMERTCREMYGAAAPELRLKADCIPPEFRKGTVKCRVIYGREIAGIEFETYSVRPVRTLRLVEDNTVDYHLKYYDRSVLNALRARRGEADEVLIVRNGLVTDTSYSNIVCVAGDKLLTPRVPLLRGVMREWMLDSGMAVEADIMPCMLRQGNSLGITEVRLVNAMLPPGRAAGVEVGCIL